MFPKNLNCLKPVQLSKTYVRFTRHAPEFAFAGDSPVGVNLRLMHQEIELADLGLGKSDVFVLADCCAFLLEMQCWSSWKEEIRLILIYASLVNLLGVLSGFAFN